MIAKGVAFHLLTIAFVLGNKEQTERFIKLRGGNDTLFTGAKNSPGPLMAASGSMLESSPDPPPPPADGGFRVDCWRDVLILLLRPADGGFRVDCWREPDLS